MRVLKSGNKLYYEVCPLVNKREVEQSILVRRIGKMQGYGLIALKEEEVEEVGFDDIRVRMYGTLTEIQSLNYDIELAKFTFEYYQLGKLKTYNIFSNSSLWKDIKFMIRK